MLVEIVHMSVNWLFLYLPNARTLLQSPMIRAWGTRAGALPGILFKIKNEEKRIPFSHLDQQPFLFFLDRYVQSCVTPLLFNNPESTSNGRGLVPKNISLFHWRSTGNYSLSKKLWRKFMPRNCCMMQYKKDGILDCLHRWNV